MSRDKQYDGIMAVLDTVTYDEELKDEITLKLCNAGYRKASEVAREIFAEIDTLLQLGRRYNMMQGDYYTFELRQSIAELKKKYTQEK